MLLIETDSYEGIIVLSNCSYKGFLEYQQLNKSARLTVMTNFTNQQWLINTNMTLLILETKIKYSVIVTNKSTDFWLSMYIHKTSSNKWKNERITRFSNNTRFVWNSIFPTQRLGEIDIKPDGAFLHSICSFTQLHLHQRQRILE